MVSWPVFAYGGFIVFSSAALTFILFSLCRSLGWLPGGARTKRERCRLPVSDSVRRQLEQVVLWLKKEDVIILDGRKRTRRDLERRFEWIAHSVRRIALSDKETKNFTVSVVSSQVCKNSPGVWTALIDVDIQYDDMTIPGNIVIAHMDEITLFEGGDDRLEKLEELLRDVMDEMDSFSVEA